MLREYIHERDPMVVVEAVRAEARDRKNQALTAFAAQVDEQAVADRIRIVAEQTSVRSRARVCAQQVSLREAEWLAAEGGRRG